tara:strand:- start:31056 stop:32147 length:1092 start_codon:yes stop_codon:yes gene_type:complete
MDQSYLKRAAEQCGFNRDVFMDRNVPTSHHNIVFLPFLGDLKSMFLLSANLLKPYKEWRSSKYIILGSWPGYQCFFPYVDEYWSIKEDSNVSKLASNAISFYNNSDVYTLCKQNLNDFFEIINSEDVIERSKGEDVRLFLPAIPSASILSENFKEGLKKRGQKVIVYPVRHIKSWQKGKVDELNVTPDFWIALVKRLIKEEMVPVLYMDHFTFNLSTEFGDKCLYVVSDNMSHVLSAFHQTGCILNVFSDIDKLAIAARCPCVSVNERQCYIEGKDYEIEDICGVIPRKNIFSFSTHTLNGMNWDTNLFDIIVKSIKDLQSINQGELATTSEINKVIPYDTIRKRQSHKLGVRFIKKRPDLGL